MKGKDNIFLLFFFFTVCCFLKKLSFLLEIAGFAYKDVIEKNFMSPAYWVICDRFCSSALHCLRGSSEVQER